MHFKTLAPVEFEQDSIDRFIALFERKGESGPHSTEGRLLSHVLNHCVANDIPFTVMFVPKAGYYIKRAYPDNFVPKSVVDDCKFVLQQVANQTGADISDTYGLLYDMETVPDTQSRAEALADVLAAALGSDVYAITPGHDTVSISRKPEGDSQ